MAIYNVAVLNGKKFDISHVCNRFNNNPELTLKDIAKEFAITRDELVERLRDGAGKDEKTRVDGVIREDRKRQKRCKQKNDSKKVISSRVEKEKTVTTTNFDEQCKKLTEQIAQAEIALNESNQKVSKLKELVAKGQQEEQRLKELIESLETEIAELQKKLKKAKEELEDVKERSQAERKKYEQDMEALTKARERER